MESTQTTQRRVRYQFEIFCMKVIDGERCDYLRKLMKKMEWESSFSDLSEAVLTNLCTFDSDPAEQYIFHVYGHQIPIKNDRLAEILLALGDWSSDVCSSDLTFGERSERGRRNRLRG